LVVSSINTLYLLELAEIFNHLLLKNEKEL